MAPGEGGTWHTRCHTDKLHERLPWEEDMWGADSPPPIKACNRKTNKIKSIEIIKRKQKKKRLCVERKRTKRKKKSEG